VESIKQQYVARSEHVEAESNGGEVKTVGGAGNLNLPTAEEGKLRRMVCNAQQSLGKEA